MLRLNRLTDYAVVVLGAMSRNSEVMTAPYLAQTTGIPQPTVSKILNALSRHDLIVSMRGAGGGYLLDRKADDISVADIIQATEGPIALAACVDGADDHCDVEATCLMRGNWNRVNTAVADALRTVSLADMMSFEHAFPLPENNPQNEALESGNQPT
ncbi:SUF system Fe-S cluster assembly regulator [Kiloniella sp. b19]|uniref:SUF system Fe-S cluster assembly regulator n=1 Tax=Kiloniella sp. GXU_MW_B19 TaxID=3141326 RepID=UPI0031E02587